MRILVSENSTRFEADLRDGLAKIPSLDLVVVRARDEAFQALESSAFDLILCDLRIPTGVGRLDAVVENGLAVQDHARAVAPGTPIIVMSAYGTMDIVKSLYESSPVEDAFGTGTRDHLTTFCKKSDLPELVDTVAAMAVEKRALDDIGISTGGRDLELSQSDIRVLRLFARRHNGAVVRLHPIGEGLSTARVVRIEVVDGYGSLVSQALAKLGDLELVRAEAANYRELVAPQLASNAFAHLIDGIFAGATRTGGLFYWFAGGAAGDGYDSPLLALIPDRDDLAVAAISSLATKLEPWVAAAHQEAVAVGDVRRLLLDNEAFALVKEQLPDDIDAIEARTVYVNYGPEHGDLHGLNVLVRSDGDAVLIDFGSILRGPIALDPVSLEFSFLFHPESAIRNSEWPAVSAAEQWTSLERYAARSPIADVVRRCRSWAHARAASDAEIYACAYAYCARQLKYPEANVERARAIARSALDALAGG
jgi:CheY-like chemotaxis protein